ncbi:tyrosine-type recombinase/integrase [Shimia thalassica]|uniref:tyrosine-type recombinase/integrase n=1 Tax=Shimia thalassica TaxID=1715693 RepID=UPI0026E3C2B8|nr:integrase family protein [Shimia thalassica]MDO6479118.1 integrase family protein [Shimia thalassica]
MLTDLQIARLKPAEKRRVVAVGDGLSIRIEPSGRKNWIARRAGRSRGLGTYPEISLADARAQAGLVSEPHLFSALWQDWFETDASKRLKRPGNATALRPLWKPLDGRRVDTLKRAELVKLLRDLKTRAPSRARSATSQLRAVLDHAVALGLIEINPLYGVSMKVTAGPVQRRDRVLSDDEIRGLWKMRADGGAGGAHARFCLFALATGCRRGEVASARRSWLSGDWLNLLPEAMKSGRAFGVFLSPFAWEQVPASNDDALFSLKAGTVEAYVRRQIGQGWSLHDLRRTAATRLTGLGVAPHVVARCLDHAVGSQSDAHYLAGDAYRSDRPAALTALGEHLAGVVSS